MMNKGTERDGVRMTEIERERKRVDKRGSKDKRKEGEKYREEGRGKDLWRLERF